MYTCAKLESYPIMLQINIRNQCRKEKMDKNVSVYGFDNGCYLDRFIDLRKDFMSQKEHSSAKELVIIKVKILIT